MTQDEYKQAWNGLQVNYPFMDGLLLSKKGGVERDEALAWNALSRMPPGQSGAFGDLVGMPDEALNKFYDTNGDLAQLSDPERMRFMAAILDLSALLDMPDRATQTAWDASRSGYGRMRELGKDQFGEDIWERVDVFYALLAEDPDAANAYIKSAPAVEQAMDWQQRTVMSSPLLAPYYTSAERIEKYLKGEMYDQAAKVYGEDLWDYFDVYYRLKDIDDKAARKYWKEHPHLEEYIKFRDLTLESIDERVARLGALIPKALPPIYREEQDEEFLPVDDKEAWIEDQILSYLEDGYGAYFETTQAQPDPTVLLQAPGGLELYNLIIDSMTLGEELPEIAKRRLGALGIDESIFSAEGGEAVAAGGGKKVLPSIRPDSKNWGEFYSQGGMPTVTQQNREVAGIVEKGIQSPSFIKTIASAIKQGKARWSDILENRRSRIYVRRELEEAFPGLKSSFLDNLNDVQFISRDLFDPGVAGYAMNPIKYSKFLWITPGARVPKMEGPDANYITIVHEMAHLVDHSSSVPPYYRISLSPAFLSALDETRNLSPSDRDAWRDSITTINEFPGLWGNDNMKIEGGGEWGGFDELYAVLFAQSRGYLDLLPPPLRPFYDMWMDFAPDQEEFYEDYPRPE